MQQTFTRRSLLRHHLHITKKRGSSVVKYLSTLSSTTEDLATTSDPVSDGDLVLFALNGLPSNYESFVTVMENRDTHFSELRAKLLLHEQHLAAYHSTRDVSSEVAFTEVNFPNGRSSGYDDQRGGTRTSIRRNSFHKTTRPTYSHVPHPSQTQSILHPSTAPQSFSHSH